MAVSDIEKLRPELLDKSLAELARLKAEIEMAEAELARREELKAKEALAAEANQHIESVLAGVKFLHDHGLLPERLSQALTRGDGQFNPATFLRAGVTPEQLLTRTITKARKPRDPNAPRRRRRRRDPVTGDLLPLDA